VFKNVILKTQRKAQKSLPVAETLADAVYMLLALPEMSAYLHFQGHAVAQLVDALPYNPEAVGFDSRWGY